MTRSNAREVAVHLIYEIDYTGEDPAQAIETRMDRSYYSGLSAENDVYAERPSKKQMDYIRRLVKLIDENRNEFDGFIERYSHGWKVDRISKTALAVLRCALCEIIYMDDIPDSAAINEAVELDKGYDEPDTVAFVNGVLGGFMRGEKGATEAVAVTDAE